MSAGLAARECEGVVGERRFPFGTGRCDCLLLFDFSGVAWGVVMGLGETTEGVIARCINEVGTSSSSESIPAAGILLDELKERVKLGAGI